MSRHRVFLGNSVIANGGTDGSKVGSKQLNMMVSLYIPVPALTTAGHVQVATEIGGTMQDLYIDGVQATLTGGETSLFHCGGFQEVQVICAGAEGAERTIPVFAILDIASGS